MCGIVGVFGRTDRPMVEAGLEALRHRGPDDGHLVSGQDFAIGARRLSIVDVDGGRQPLSNESGSVWGLQNGELYNAPILAKELRSRGHTVHGHCDTAVLPHLYEDYGVQLPEYLDGMFAVAVWDDTKKIGVLARDRMGKKPLYHCSVNGALYFASEIKALLHVPGFQRNINYEALHHYLSYKHVPHPLTIFEGIWALPPAHVLIYRLDYPIAVKRYWKLSFDPNDEITQSEESGLTDRLLELLRRGVERRMMSDVPIGFFLSGGLDSSLSTALAAEMSSEPIKTFTLTYSGESTTQGKEDDRRWARWVAQKYGTEHYEETVNFTDFPDSLRRVLTCFDEPFAGVVASYFLSQAIARHVKVALSGDGADELFGSYLSHRLAQPLSRFSVYRETGDPAALHPYEDQSQYLSGLLEYDNRDQSLEHSETDARDWVWRSKLVVLNEFEKSILYTPETLDAIGSCDTARHIRDSLSLVGTADPLNRILGMEFVGIFPDQVLRYVDSLSMAHSLEVRSAYLDTEFVTFIAGLPGVLKINNGETKYLLKRAAERYFPKEMVYRPKEGFQMPVAQWLLNDLQDYVRDTLNPERIARHKVFRPESVTALVNRLYKTGSDYRDANKVLALLVFEEWYDLYMK